MVRQILLIVFMILMSASVYAQKTKQQIVKQYQTLAVAGLKSATLGIEEPYLLIGCQVKINMDDTSYYSFTVQQNNALCDRVDEEVGGFRYRFSEPPPYHLADMYVHLGKVKKRGKR